MLNKISLTEAIRALGRAHVFVGDAFTEGGLVPLGATEGDIEVEELEATNDYTLPEYTGEAVHDRQVMQGGVVLTIPLIIGPAVAGGGDDGTAIYDMISSIGDGSGGGYSSPQDVVSTNLLLIPDRELGDGIAYPAPAGPWDPAAPKHAIWIWKAVPEPGTMPFRQGDGGKIIREVTFRSFFDTTRPEGHKLWSRGDAVAHGIQVRL